MRLHYVYPYPHVDEVIGLMCEGAVLPYLDIPFQHASPDILKRMRRPANQEKVLERIAAWRRQCPELTIRSTFIVGFPTETEEDFTYLLDWLEEAQLDRVGCFRFEPVQDADCNALDGHVPEEVKEERWHRFMQKQQEISRKRLQGKIGKTYDVLIDTVEPDGVIGRSHADAPEIDGVVHVSGKRKFIPGSIVKVKIDSADDYDLFGQAV